MADGRRGFWIFGSNLHVDSFTINIMSEPDLNSPPNGVQKGIEDMSINQTSEVETGLDDVSKSAQPERPIELPSHCFPTNTATHSPSSNTSNSTTMSPSRRAEKTVGGDITFKQEPGQPPKLARSSTQKVAARAPQLFSCLKDKTSEATGVFQVIDDCIYTNKYLGYAEHAMECDCLEEWGK